MICRVVEVSSRPATYSSSIPGGQALGFADASMRCESSPSLSLSEPFQLANEGKGEGPFTEHVVVPANIMPTPLWEHY